MFLTFGCRCVSRRWRSTSTSASIDGRWHRRLLRHPRHDALSSASFLCSGPRRCLRGTAPLHQYILFLPGLPLAPQGDCQGRDFHLCEVQVDLLWSCLQGLLDLQHKHVFRDQILVPETIPDMFIPMTLTARRFHVQEQVHVSAYLLRP